MEVYKARDLQGGQNSVDLLTKIKSLKQEVDEWKFKCQKLELKSSGSELDFKMKDFESRNNMLVKENERLIHLNKMLATQQDEWRAKFLSIERVFGDSKNSAEDRARDSGNEKKLKTLSAEKEALEKHVKMLIDKVGDLEKEIQNYKCKAISLVASIEG